MDVAQSLSERDREFPIVKRQPRRAGGGGRRILRQCRRVGSLRLRSGCAIPRAHARRIAGIIMPAL